MELTLNATVRENKGRKGELSQFRKDHMIPGVVYGGKKETLAVVVDEKELTKLRKEGGANAIIRLKTAAGEDTVILKELQRHVVTSQPIHADFQRISMTTKIEVKVPLHVLGEAPGVKTGGGILQYILREFKVRALPAEIPQAIDVDISNLQLNEKIEVKDLKVPTGVEVLELPEQIIVTVVQPTEEEVVAEPVVEGAVPEGTEPEVIAKGKKEEEGEEGAEGAKPGAAPAKGAAASGKGGAAPAAGAPAKGGKPEGKKEK
ncbi:MAG: 50S ribosomal protein L25 [Elusimicrobia bacterium]|nr:50S ribosomal protein L25 [Elusimicrobiota bacterium]